MAATAQGPSRRGSLSKVSAILRYGMGDGGMVRQVGAMAGLAVACRNRRGLTPSGPQVTAGFIMAGLTVIMDHIVEDTKRDASRVTGGPGMTGVAGVIVGHVGEMRHRMVEEARGLVDMAD